MFKTSKIKFAAVIILCAALASGFSAYAAAAAVDNEIKVLVDGERIVFDQPPILIDGRVMVPVRFVAEAMGWDVRMVNSTLIELMKTSKYTDGYRTFLFSNHMVKVNLENEWFSKSIMVGVGHFFNKAEDQKIPFTVKPIIKNGRTLIGVRELANCLYASVDWDGPNRTVIITSGEVPYYDGNGLPNRDELFEEMRSYNKAIGPLVKVGEPIPESSKTDTLPTPSFEPAGVLTSAPEVGTFPAKILLPGKTDVTSPDSYYEPYKTRVGYGCNWYAYGRFYEVYGYEMPIYYTGGATFIDEVEKSDSTLVRAERDFNKIEPGCIAVYWRKNNGGHVVFVEYVERDKNGNPVNVYYTECLNSDGSGIYKPASDGKVKKAAFERFKKSSSGTKDFMGFIMPK